jgi:SSS family solute:Na+ symporter
MELSGLDIGVLTVFFVCVITIGLFKSRKEKTSEDYFLAGRGLKWWLIGFSLSAANISAEQFVGMSGQAAKISIGLAVASYEWVAAITLVVVAFFFLPKFLKSGIFTIPEYLEYRFNHTSRLVMSLLMVIIYLGVTIPTVIYLGAKALSPLFREELMGIPINITTLSWFVGILAGVYVAAGGLKACAWADLIQGSALIIGGAVIMVLTFMALDDPGKFEGIDVAAVNTSLGVGDGATFGEKFSALKESSMHMVLPRASTFLPWTALLLGIWIPNFYYWGLNQYIMQRTLGAHSLREGQRGVVFAAFLKLIIPFVVCIPGIIAFTLYAGKMGEDAMKDARFNAPVLSKYEQAKLDPSSSDKVFPFDGDFASLHPELAENICLFNIQVAMPLSSTLPRKIRNSRRNYKRLRSSTRHASRGKKRKNWAWSILTMKRRTWRPVRIGRFCAASSRRRNLQQRRNRS